MDRARTRLSDNFEFHMASLLDEVSVMTAAEDEEAEQLYTVCKDALSQQLYSILSHILLFRLHMLVSSLFVF